jgi:hypothetical protein
MNSAQEVARTKRAVAAARAMITQEHGLVFGAKRVLRAMAYLSDDMPGQFPTFGEFLDRIPMTTPLGEARLMCTEQFLFESDVRLAVVEAEFRTPLYRESLALIKVLTGA